jgi:hypothetical protein
MGPPLPLGKLPPMLASLPSIPSCPLVCSGRLMPLLLPSGLNPGWKRLAVAGLGLESGGVKD